jgi:hypothetical protein
MEKIDINKVKEILRNSKTPGEIVDQLYKLIGFNMKELKDDQKIQPNRIGISDKLWLEICDRIVELDQKLRPKSLPGYIWMDIGFSSDKKLSYNELVLNNPIQTIN